MFSSSSFRPNSAYREYGYIFKKPFEVSATQSSGPAAVNHTVMASYFLLDS